jgi:hypothetical protein
MIYAPPDLVEGHFGVLRARREKLILDWRKQQQSRAAVRITIEKMLDPGGTQLPRADRSEGGGMTFFTFLIAMYCVASAADRARFVTENPSELDR